MAKICKECGRIFRPGPGTPDLARCPDHQGHRYRTRKARGQRTGSTHQIRKARPRILERDGGCCHWCGTRITLATMHLDHLVPVIAGGSDDDSNLVAACAACNLRRGG